jgi:hypothetical protein
MSIKEIRDGAKGTLTLHTRPKGVSFHGQVQSAYQDGGITIRADGLIHPLYFVAGDFTFVEDLPPLPTAAGSVVFSVDAGYKPVILTAFNRWYTIESDGRTTEMSPADVARWATGESWRIYDASTGLTTRGPE